MKTTANGAALLPDLLPDLLLVEPQFVLRRTIVAVAHDLGVARFQEASSVDVAVQRLEAQPFDGVVLDISGGAPAFELLARLRHGALASRADIPIIAMTSSAVDAARDMALASRGDALILRKPFKVAELLQIVQRMTASAALSRH